TLSRASYYAAVDAQQASAQARKLRDQIASMRSGATGAGAEALTALDKKLEALAPTPDPNAGGRGGRGGGGAPAARGRGGAGRGASTAAGQAAGGRFGGAAAQPGSLAGASASLAGVMNLLQGADVRPTTVQLKAIAAARASASATVAKWTSIKTVDLPATNAK